MKKEIKEIIYGFVCFVIWFVVMYALAYYTQSERLMMILKAIILIFVGIFGVCLAVGFVWLIVFIFSSSVKGVNTAKNKVIEIKNKRIEEQKKSEQKIEELTQQLKEIKQILKEKNISENKNE